MENKVYTVPLKDVNKYPRGVRTKKAMKKLKKFLKRHTNSKDIKIGNKLNEFLWSRGGKKPPKSIKVAVSEIEEQIYCNLPGEEIKEEVVKKEFECDECGKTFSSERELKAHISQVHKEKEEETKEEEVEEEESDMYKCPECGKEFETKRGLSIHKSQQHPEEEAEEDYEDALSGTIAEAKELIGDMDNPDYEKLLELEKEAKDRKGMKTFLEGKLDE